MGRSPRSSNGRPLRQVDALKHNEATRRNIPTAEMDSFFRQFEINSAIALSSCATTEELEESSWHGATK
jgi:hypothetical protein